MGASNSSQGSFSPPSSTPTPAPVTFSVTTMPLTTTSATPLPAQEKKKECTACADVESGDRKSVHISSPNVPAIYSVKPTPSASSLAPSPSAAAFVASTSPPGATANASTLETTVVEAAFAPPGANFLPTAQESKYAYMHSGCPVTRRELGRSSWAYLHSTAAYYPDHPSPQAKQEMKQFLQLYIKLYPCGYCADRSMEELQRNPPKVENRLALSQWMCELHNEVNDRMNKPIFDCRRVEERWKVGAADGSCK